MKETGEKRYTNCTTAGPTFVTVKDGKMIRCEPMHFTEEEYRPWKIEVNGKTYTPPPKWPLLCWGHTARKWVYENRVEYPQKRVDWDPNGKRNPENRGISGYQRITWEEGFDILTNEINRIKETYGPESILTGFSAHPEWGSLHYFFSDALRFFGLLGTTHREVTPISWEGWFSGASFIWGHFTDQGCMPAEDTLQDVSEDSELIVLWGADPITKNIYTGWDTPRPLRFWKELGKKIILIEPYGNDTGMAYADKWIPIIPGTDAAMAAAIAHVWITEGTYDQAYLDTHSIGFDEEHLPEGAPAGSSWKSYIVGLFDGIAKTPEWAEKITGVPSRVSKALASEWGSKPTALWAMWGGASRRAYAHEWARMLVVLQAMQGLGKPGVNIISTIMSLCGPYDKRQVGLPGYADAGIRNPQICKIPYNHLMANPTEKILCCRLLEEAINNPPVTWKGGRLLNRNKDNFYKEYTYPAEGAPEIHMMWNRGSTSFNPPNYSREFRVYQHPKIETVVIQAPWFDRECRYADLVLPTTTNFEREDLTEPGKAGMFIAPSTINIRTQVYHQKCIDPIGESKTDLEIFCELAKRLEILDQYMEGNTEEDLRKKLYKESNIPMTYEEFKSKGYYAFPALPDYKPNKQLKAFYEDPEAHPLGTPSGKLEIFSQWIFEEEGGDNPECRPVPHYIPEWEGRYTEELTSKYPLQLLTNHPKWRFHGKFDQVSWLRELYKIKGPDGYEYEPMYMHPADASDRGLKDGDIVRAFNDRGQILCGISTTQRLIRGVVRCDYGSWRDPLNPDSEGSIIDRGGDANNLTSHRPMSNHHIGIAPGSTLVEVEKADLETLAEEYPEGWAGKYATWKKEDA